MTCPECGGVLLGQVSAERPHQPICECGQQRSDATVESRGFLIGGRLHIPRETITPSGEPGFGGFSKSLCGRFEGVVYSAELARFHYPNLPVCLWCEGRAARGT